MDKGAFSGAICDLKRSRTAGRVFTKIHGDGDAKFALRGAGFVTLRDADDGKEPSGTLAWIGGCRTGKS